MQHFKSKNSNARWAFDDDVTFEIEGGIYKFFTALGEPILAPHDLEPAQAPVDNPLQRAQTAKLLELTNSYATAIQQNVHFMGHEFQADLDSQANLSKVLTGSGGTLPQGFYWLDLSNNQLNLTFAQLQGLSSVMLAQGWTAFQNLQVKKNALKSTATVAEVEEIFW